MPVTTRLFTRAAVGWLLFLLLAVLNGAFRQALLIPTLGESAGHIVSTLLLAVIIVGATWLLLPWIRAASTRDAWVTGALWLMLTVAFEFLGGHYLFGDSWDALLAAYNLAEGHIWILIPITTLLAPVMVRTRQSGKR